MKIDRKEAIKQAPRGVLFQGRELRSSKEFPAEAEGQEFTAMRDASGNLTRAGMEHVIATGGSVMHNGTLLERVDDLPAEEDLAAGDSRRLDAIASSYDEQIATLQGRRAAIDREQQRAEAKATAPAAGQEGSTTQTPGQHGPTQPTQSPTSPPTPPASVKPATAGQTPRRKE